MTTNSARLPSEGSLAAYTGTPSARERDFQRGARAQIAVGHVQPDEISHAKCCEVARLDFSGRLRHLQRAHNKAFDSSTNSTLSGNITQIPRNKADHRPIEALPDRACKSRREPRADDVLRWAPGSLYLPCGDRLQRRLACPGEARGSPLHPAAVAQRHHDTYRCGPNACIPATREALMRQRASLERWDGLPRSRYDPSSAGESPIRSMGDPGLEPGTSSLSEKRSNHLS